MPPRRPMREEGQRACRPADQAKCGIAEETPSRSRARSSRRATLPSAAWFPFMVSAAFLFVTRAPPASMDAPARRRRCRRAWRPSASSLPDWRVDDPWPKRPSSRFCFVVRPLNVLPGRPRASDRTLPGAALLPAAGIATVRHRLKSPPVQNRRRYVGTASRHCNVGPHPTVPGDVAAPARPLALRRVEAAVVAVRQGKDRHLARADGLRGQARQVPRSIRQVRVKRLPPWSDASACFGALAEAAHKNKLVLCPMLNHLFVSEH